MSCDPPRQGPSPRTDGRSGALIGATMALLLGAGILQAQRLPFQDGESLQYTAGFRLFAVGTTTMEVTRPDSAIPDAALQITSRTETAPFFDRLYRIRDRVEVWLDPTHLVLRRMERDIQEGRYRQRDTTSVDLLSGIIVTQGDTLPAQRPVHDPIGAIYYLRSLPLAVGDTVRLNIYDGRRLRRVGIRVEGEELVKVPAGEFHCLILRPAPLDSGRLTKVDGLLHLWLATDEARTPVRLEQKTRFGTMVLNLLEAN